MTENFNDIFNSEINKRLSDRDWSAITAEAVIRKDRSIRMSVLIDFFSWLMPVLAAASIVYAVFFSGSFPGLFKNEQLKGDTASSFITEFTGLDYSVGDDLF